MTMRTGRAAVSVVAVGLMVLATSACGGSAEPDDSQPVVPERTEAPSATVHKTQAQACAGVAPRMQEVDPQDLAELRLRLEHEPRVRLTATTVCGTTPVISVGVATYDAKIPREGRAGTPIIVYIQPPIYLF